MSDAEITPQGQPTGGDPVGENTLAGNDGTAGEDSLAGDAGLTDGASLADTADAGEHDPDDLTVNDG